MDKIGNMNTIFFQKKSIPPQLWSCLFLLLFALGLKAQPQNLCTSVVNTGSNHTVVIAANAPRLNGNPLPSGSHITIGFMNGNDFNCVNYVKWNGTAASIAAYGKESGVAPRNGFNDGEAFQFRVELPDGTILDNINATYSPASGFITHQGNYANNGISQISNLNITTTVTPSGPSVCGTPIITSGSQTVAIPLSPQIDGANLQNGAYIIIGYKDNAGTFHCINYVEWNGNPTAIAAYEDDATTNVKDGFSIGDDFVYQIELPNGTILDDLVATYEPIGGLVTAQGKFKSSSDISRIKSLTNNIPRPSICGIPEVTSGSQTIAIPKSPQINGAPLTNGAFIIVGYEDNAGIFHCVNYTQWEGKPTSIAAYINDNGATNKNGFDFNDKLVYRIEMPNGTIHENILATYEPLGGIVTAQGIFEGDQEISQIKSLEDFDPINCDRDKPVIALAFATSPTCANGNDGALTISITNTHELKSVKWTGGPTGTTFANIAAGDYTVVVTDVHDCTTSRTFTLDDSPEITLSAAIVHEECTSFGTVTLTVAGGKAPYTFDGTLTAATSNNIINDLKAGTYNVKATDADGCITPSISVNIENKCGCVDIDKDGVCAEDDCDDNNQNITYGPGTACNDGDDCTENDVYDADCNCVGTPIDTDKDGTPDCDDACPNDANKIAPGDCGCGVSDVDTDKDGVPDCNDKCPGFDDRIDSDGDGTPDGCEQCDGSLKVVLSENHPVACYGGNNGKLVINVQGGTAPYTISWSNGVSTLFNDNLTANTYTVTVKDVNNCSVDASFTLTEASPITVAANITAQNCNPNTGKIDVTVSGGTAPYTYNWVFNGTSEDLTGLNAGEYHLVVTDRNNCKTDRLTFKVEKDCGCDNITDAGTIGFGNTCETETAICLGLNTPSLNSCSLPSGGSGTLEYVWLKSIACPNFVPTTLENMPGWTLIANSNTPVLNLNDYDESICLVRLARRAGCDTYLGSNIIKLNVDKGVKTWYADLDKDGFGDPNNTLKSCLQPPGFISTNGDCDDTNEHIPTTPGKSCNDNNPNTVDDKIQADGCTCKGTPVVTSCPTNVKITPGLGKVTISGLTAVRSYIGIYNQTQLIEACNNCPETVSFNLPEGNYAILIQFRDQNNNVIPNCPNIFQSLVIDGACVDNDKDGICATEDCNDNDNKLPAAPGTACNDNNENTIDDKIQADGCTCKGTPVNPTECDNLEVLVLGNAIKVTGLTGALHEGMVELVIGSEVFYQCSDLRTDLPDCPEEIDLSNLPNGKYEVTVKFFDKNQGFICLKRIEVTINDNCKTDTDKDGTPDCNDGCPTDANKTAPGDCGCGVADTDTDKDGTPDCKDGCPTDANKTAPGDCGCGVADTDTDKDGTPDCKDGCPTDANKTAPGDCGCGVADTDTDKDGTPDCNDECPSNPDKVKPDACGCDPCPNCDVKVTTLNVTPPTCPDRKDGVIAVQASNGVAPYTYKWSTGVTGSNGITGIGAGSYNVSITDAANCTVVKTFNLVAPNPITINATVIDASCDKANGAIALTVNGGNGDYQFLWNNVLSTKDQNNLSAGTYTVVVRDKNFCSASQTIEVKNVTKPDCNNGGGTTVSCDKATITYGNGQIKVAIGDGKNYRYVVHALPLWGVISECNYNCGDNWSIDVPDGEYVIRLYENGEWRTPFCETQIKVGNVTCIDADGDGICATEDCNDNDAAAGKKQLPGTQCDDNDANTNNDVIQPDGCTCLGTPIIANPCVSKGGDKDNDGVCADDDCNDNDAAVGRKQTPGTQCNDNDANTENDVIQPDGCSCKGTPKNTTDPTVCDFSITKGDGTITINGMDEPFVKLNVYKGIFGDEVHSCNFFDNCPQTKTLTGLAKGTYTVKIETYNSVAGEWVQICNTFQYVEVGGTATGCTDRDNDGVCAEDDCNDNDAAVGKKQAAGTQCDDGNADTDNDVIQSDGCTCKGTPKNTGTPDCGNVTATVSNGNIIVSGLTSPIEQVKLYKLGVDDSQTSIDECNGDCGNEWTFTGLAAGDYLIHFTLRDKNWVSLCPNDAQDLELRVTVTNSLNTIASSRTNGKKKPRSFTSVKLYPNPAQHEAWIDLGAWNNQAVDVVIYNHLSQVMLEKHIEKASSAPERIDLQRFSNGLYYVQIRAKGEETIIKKLFVSKLH
jgi:hypothetical protein